MSLKRRLIVLYELILVPHFESVNCLRKKYQSLLETWYLENKLTYLKKWAKFRSKSSFRKA